MTFPGLSATSRSAQYPAGNQTHSQPSLAGRGGSIYVFGVTGALLYDSFTICRPAGCIVGTDDDGSLLVGPSIPEMLGGRYRLVVLR